MTRGNTAGHNAGTIRGTRVRTQRFDTFHDSSHTAQDRLQEMLLFFIGG
jgi:hypothetical protein